MAQNSISTAILIIAGVVAAAALINAMLPAVSGMTGSATALSDRSNDRMKTDIRIISEGLDLSVANSLHVYIKNIGGTKIQDANLQKTDVYFGNASSMSKCKSSGLPSWQYSIQGGDGDTTWEQGETLDVWIKTDAYDFGTDGQKVRIVLYNGASTEDEYTL